MGLSVWFGVQDLRCRAQGFELFCVLRLGLQDLGFRALSQQLDRQRLLPA